MDNKKKLEIIRSMGEVMASGDADEAEAAAETVAELLRPSEPIDLHASAPLGFVGHAMIDNESPCYGKLEYDAAKGLVVCDQCGQVFEVKPKAPQ